MIAATRPKRYPHIWGRAFALVCSPVGRMDICSMFVDDLYPR
jgi:hypothetical protein